MDGTKKGIYILENDKDNIYIVDYKKKENNIYTINSNELQNVKYSISQFDDIFRKIKIPLSPVLDGTSHSVYISNFKEYRQTDCSNLWYFVKGDFTNGSLYSATKRQK